MSLDENTKNGTFPRYSESSSESPPGENTTNQKQKIFTRCSKSPVDVNVINTQQIHLAELKWINYHTCPENMQLTNSGETCSYNGVTQ